MNIETKCKALIIANIVEILSWVAIFSYGVLLVRGATGGLLATLSIICCVRPISRLFDCKNDMAIIRSESICLDDLTKNKLTRLLATRLAEDLPDTVDYFMEEMMTQECPRFVASPDYNLSFMYRKNSEDGAQAFNVSIDKI